MAETYVEIVVLFRGGNYCFLNGELSAMQQEMERLIHLLLQKPKAQRAVLYRGLTEGKPTVAFRIPEVVGLYMRPLPAVSIQERLVRVGEKLADDAKQGDDWKGA